jgi:hypothetical protein
MSGKETEARCGGAEEDAEDLRALAARIEAPPLALDDDADEGQLEQAALELRRHCLARAHRQADPKLKTPCAGTVARLPCGSRVSLGYERDLDVSALERRGEEDYPSPPGWRSVRVLCRSGQAALACLLHLVVSTAGESRLRTHHAGRYFETKGLLELWPDSVLERQPADTREADLLIGEPVACGGGFEVPRPSGLPRARQALLVDTTLSGPAVDLAPWFACHEGPVAAVFRSGLKLDQAGLELANVGIVQLMVQEGSGLDLDTLAEKLRHIRGLTATGLTLDELGALSAPWFLDRGYFGRYTKRLFAHNEALARAIGRGSPVFEPDCHPSLLSDSAPPAAFCALRLRNGGLDDHRRLLAEVEHEVERRGIVATKGGSFGFRGIRYELVEPEPADGVPFLRVALGFRGGPSTTAMIDLLTELARGNFTAGRSVHSLASAR